MSQSNDADDLWRETIYAEDSGNPDTSNLIPGPAVDDTNILLPRDEGDAITTVEGGILQSPSFDPL